MTIAEPVVGLALATGRSIVVRDPILSLLSHPKPRVRAKSRLIFCSSMRAGCRCASFHTSPCCSARSGAGGDTRTGLYYDIIAVFLCGIPIVALLGMVVHVPFQMLVLAMFVAEDSIKLVLGIRRFRSRQWIRRLTMPGDNAYEQ